MEDLNPALESTSESSPPESVTKRKPSLEASKGMETGDGLRRARRTCTIALVKERRHKN